MPRANIAIGEYYHIYNRGVEKRAIFLNNQDRWRFLTMLCIFQGENFSLHENQTRRFVFDVKHRMFDKPIFKEVLNTQSVELVNFCLMPNHFHLLVGEKKEGGIAKFMQRLSNAYTKYFNIRYRRSGHLFSGKYQSVHIDREEYLHYLSAYIHLNPRELPKWKGKEANYPWSTFHDLVKENRWSSFLQHELISDQFPNKKEYKRFIEETPIKRKLTDDYLIDNNE